MSDAFDGAGRPFRGPSFRALIVLLVISLIVIALLWVATGWGLGVIEHAGMSAPPQEIPALPGAR